MTENAYNTVNKHNYKPSISCIYAKSFHEVACVLIFYVELSSELEDNQFLKTLFKMDCICTLNRVLL